MPWDLHLSFASAGAARDGTQYADLSIEQPFTAPNRLIERLMMMQAFRELYFQHLKDFSSGIFAPAAMNARIDAMQVAVRRADQIFWDMGADRGVGPTTRPDIGARGRADLRSFVAARVDSVLRQLSGLASGYSPGERRMPPPRPAPRPAGRFNLVRPAPTPVRPAATSAAQTALNSAAVVSRTLIQNIDAERDAVISREEAESAVRLFFLAAEPPGQKGMNEHELARGFDRMDRLLDPYVVPLGPDGKRPLDDDPDRPSVMWARIVMKQADADRDGRVSLQEMLAAVARFVISSDLTRDKALNQRELLSALERLALAAVAEPPSTQPAKR